MISYDFLRYSFMLTLQSRQILLSPHRKLGLKDICFHMDFAVTAAWYIQFIAHIL